MFRFGWGVPLFRDVGSYKLRSGWEESRFSELDRHSMVLQDFHHANKIVKSRVVAAWAKRMMSSTIAAVNLVVGCA